jgi:hypothetical protein
MHDLRDRLLLEIHPQIRVDRLLVRVVHAREPLDFPPSCLGVQALAIRFLAELERRCDVDLEEGSSRRSSGLLDDVSGSLSRVGVRGGGGSDDSGASSGELSL